MSSGYPFTTRADSILHMATECIADRAMNAGVCKLDDRYCLYDRKVLILQRPSPSAANLPLGSPPIKLRSKGLDQALTVGTSSHFVV